MAAVEAIREAAKAIREATKALHSIIRNEESEKNKIKTKHLMKKK